MAHDGRGFEGDLPSGPPDPPTPLEILDVHEIALVEGADLVDGGPTHEQRCPNRPIHEPGLVVVPGAGEELVVTHLRCPPAVSA